jgi:monooxygenase
MPQNEDASVTEERWLNLSSGYIQRVIDQLPKQGSKSPWKQHSNYVLDALSLRARPLNDGVMKFSHQKVNKYESPVEPSARRS